ARWGSRSGGGTEEGRWRRERRRRRLRGSQGRQEKVCLTHFLGGERNAGPRPASNHACVTVAAGRGLMFIVRGVEGCLAAKIRNTGITADAQARLLRDTGACQ